MDFTKYWNSFWSLVFALTAIVVVIGNLITVGVFLKRKLRTRPHFLLISLAIADLMVGALAIPLYTAVGMYGTEPLLILSFQCVDIFTGVLSIFTLASISLERMHAIIWPLRHRTLTSRFYASVIGIPWVLALLGILARVLIHFFIITRTTFIVTVMALLATPLGFTCIAYFLIWRQQKSRFQFSPQAGRDKKLTKTLSFITGAFVVTWLPFLIINMVVPVCFTCRTWPNFLFHIMKLLQFSNSFLNVIVYPLRITEYKEALFGMVFSCASSTCATRRETNTDGNSGKSSLSYKTRSQAISYVQV